MFQMLLHTKQEQESLPESLDELDGALAGVLVTDNVGRSSVSVTSAGAPISRGGRVDSVARFILTATGSSIVTGLGGRMFF